MYTFTSNSQNFVEPTFRQLPIAVKDFNNDTYQDIVLVNPHRNNIEAFLGIGDGTFEDRPVYATFLVSHPSHIVLEDMNQDHTVDIIVADFDQNSLVIFFGHGNGTFADGRAFSLGNSRPFTFIVHDFNGDTYLDILTGNYGTGDVGFLFSFGNGTFNRMQTFSIDDDFSVSALAAGDLNHDSQVDFVMTNEGTNTVSIFLGYDNVTFVKHMTYSTGSDSAPKSIALADFNNDGHYDLIVANYGHDNICVFFGYGNGNFYLHGTYANWSRFSTLFCCDE